jgi:hypothetical protein
MTTKGHPTIRRAVRITGLSLAVLALVILGFAASTDQPFSLNPKNRAVSSPGFGSFFTDLFVDQIDDCAELRDHMLDPDQALRAVVERNGYHFELEYRPAECAACQELPDAKAADPQFVARRTELAGTASYLLRISRGVTSIEHPGLTVSDGLIKDLVEVHGRDTVSCAFVHREILPDMVPYEQLLIAFDRPQDATAGTVILKDSQGTWGGDVILIISPAAMQQFISALPSTVQRPRS